MPSSIVPELLSVVDLITGDMLHALCTMTCQVHKILGPSAQPSCLPNQSLARETHRTFEIPCPCLSRLPTSHSRRRHVCYSRHFQPTSAAQLQTGTLASQPVILAASVTLFARVSLVPLRFCAVLSRLSPHLIGGLQALGGPNQISCSFLCLWLDSAFVGSRQMTRNSIALRHAPIDYLRGVTQDSGTT